jgi:hypothetical protein
LDKYNKSNKRRGVNSRCTYDHTYWYMTMLQCTSHVILYHVVYNFQIGVHIYDGKPGWTNIIKVINVEVEILDAHMTILIGI